MCLGFNKLLLKEPSPTAADTEWRDLKFLFLLSLNDFMSCKMACNNDQFAYNHTLEG